ncbi:MAG: c-type cytochrome domain-containing protein [Planctomycetota bacterium]
MRGWRISWSLVVCGLAVTAITGLPRRATAQDAAAGEAKATMLQQAADEALGRKTAAQKLAEELQAKAKPFREALTKAKSEETKAGAAAAAAEKDLAPKLEVVKKAEADKPALDKLAADTAAVAQASVETKNAYAKLAGEIAVAAKTSAEIAAKAKEALDKAPTDAAAIAAKAAADKFAADADAMAKAATAKIPELDKAVADSAAKAKVEADKLAVQVKLIADSTAAAKVVQDLVATQKAAQAKGAEEAKQAEAGLAAVQPDLDKAVAGLAAVTTEHVEKLQGAQGALAEIGKFVYFSKDIAPVFVKRCVACHNARTAKGRYNMETFTAVMKGGEQGDTIIPTDGELSVLCVMIDNGSMPKDADPLTKEEIERIKKWITLGAVLDAGKDADAPLTSIMPKLPQPAAPESYRVPVSITGLAFSPDGTQLASSGYHEVLIWNVADGAQLRRITNVAERTHEIQYSPDGSLIAVAAGTPAQNGEIKLFKAADGTLVKDLVTTADAMFAVAFSPDGKRLAAGGADRAIRVFNVETGAQELLIEDHADWVMGIAWSPDGAKLASASRDKTSKVFDAKTGDSLITFPGHGEPVFGVQFLPSGTEIATAGRDKQIRIWNATNATQVRAIGGFGNEVFRIIITPDGRLFSCSADQTAREHKLDGTQVRVFTGHKDWVYAVAFNPATKKLATGSWEGEVRIWNAEDAKGMLDFVAAPGYKAPTTAAVK